jgi:hypothetical protein
VVADHGRPQSPSGCSQSVEKRDAGDRNLSGLFAALQAWGERKQQPHQYNHALNHRSHQPHPPHQLDGWNQGLTGNGGPVMTRADAPAGDGEVLHRCDGPGIISLGMLPSLEGPMVHGGPYVMDGPGSLTPYPILCVHTANRCASTVGR